MATNNKGYLIDKDSNRLYPNVYPVGSVIITSTKDNPDNLYGGTWELIFKKCEDKTIVSGDTGNTYFTRNTTNCSAILLYINIFNNVLYIRLQWTNNVVLDDNAYTIGNFNWSNIGLLGDLTLTQYLYSVDDAANGQALMTFALDGTVTSVDVLTKVSSGTIAVGNNMKMTSVTPLPYNSIKDELCNEWHWKRTA